MSHVPPIGGGQLNQPFGGVAVVSRVARVDMNITNIAAPFLDPFPYIFMGILFALFYPLERLAGVVRMKKWGRSYLLDIQYSLMALTYFPLVGFCTLCRAGAYRAHTTAAGAAPITHLSFAFQFLAVVFLYDCTVYIRHRFFHTPAAWPFHSIHHSSEEVNWISAERSHPADNLSRILIEILLFLGLYKFCHFSAAVFPWAAIFVGVYNFFIHVNCRWTYGPLKFIFASPVFHRWHHATDAAAQNRNFASIFSILDLACGTFYMPEDKLPLDLGLTGEPSYPKNLWQQVFYPFKRRSF